MKKGRICGPGLTALPEKKRWPNFLWLPGLIFTILICGLVSGTKAQSVWNKTYTQGRPVMLFGSVLQADTNFIITGTTYGITGAFKPALNKLSNTGNTVKFKAADDSTNTFYNCYSNALTRGYNGSIVFTGESYDSLSYMMFAITDTSLDSVKIFRYFMPYTYTWYGNVICAAYGDYFVAGIRADSTPNADIFLSKLNKDGELQWTRLYNSYERDEAKSIIPLPNGNLLLGCFRTDYGDPVEHANTWLIEVDTAGLIVRQWFDPSDSTYAAEGLHQTQDGGFIYGAQKKYLQSVNDVYKIATVIKMDTNFNRKWVFTDGSYNDVTGIYDLEELSDGSFVGCGNKPFYNGDSSIVSGWVVKLTANGNVVWNRTYAGLTAQVSRNYLYDIDVLSDGGFVVVGQCQNILQQPSQVGWFLKLDSNGCEVENCLVGINDPQPYKEDFSSQIQIQPNPATSQVTISVNESPAFLTVSDVTGRQFLAQQLTDLNNTIDIQHLPDGVYLLAVETKGSKVVKRLVKQ